jgi:hypothetical protein
MNWVELISTAAGLLAVFEAGYLAGRRRANKKRKSAEDELIANRLQHVLGAVRIGNLECEPRSVTHGQTISMIFTIASEVEFPYQVWLGASAIDVHGHEYWDASQDKTVILEKGKQTCRRDLTIPRDAARGTQRLIGAVWLGQRAYVEHSIQIASYELANILTIN